MHQRESFVCLDDAGEAVRPAILWLDTRATDEINSALSARYGQGEVPYVTYRDISPAFLKNGAVDISLFSDPQEVPPGPALHPSPEGQERMAAALEPTLSKLLRDGRH